MEAPYRVPAHLGLTRLQTIVAAKRSAAADHVWALREDPGYFADVVRDYKEHRQEMLLDENGRQHPILQAPTETTFWNRVLGNVTVDAHFSLVIWENIYQQILNLKSLKQKYSKDIMPNKELPKEYMDALQKLHFRLEQSSRGPIGVLKTGVPASPPLRSFWVREPQVPGTTMIQVKSRTGLEREKNRERLMWIFGTLWDEQQLFLVGLNTLMDELERLTQSEQKAKELLSPWVARAVSDLSVMSQCLHQLHLYQPWAVSIETGIDMRRDELRADYDKETSGLAEINNKNFEGTSLANLGTPSDGKFYYPVDKRRNRENTEAMRQAEENLDAYWQAVDRHFLSKAGKSPYEAIKHLLVEDRVLQRTPEWVEPTKTPKAVPESEVSDVLYKPLSQFYHDLEHQTGRGIGRAVPFTKPKVKSRNAASTTESGVAPTPEQLERHKPDIQPTFIVDKRALKVFSTLFYTPSPSGQPGEVTWTDFLHAMVSTDFAPEKLYGSVWQFTPAKLDVERSIQFHEPHPSGKIPFLTARRHGRRLSRAYGWHSGMFVLT